MDPRQHTKKEELTRQLASYRSTLKMPDTRQLVSQSKTLLNVAGKLPASIQTRPARTLMIAAGTACIVALLLKPRRRRKKKEESYAITPTKSVPHQILAWTLTTSQPLIRVWLTERTRRWMRK